MVKILKRGDFFLELIGKIERNLSVAQSRNAKKIVHDLEIALAVVKGMYDIDDLMDYNNYADLRPREHFTDY
jgi:hypothetical protein